MRRIGIAGIVLGMAVALTGCPTVPQGYSPPKVVSVVEFVPIGPASTRIVMSGVGYGPGPGFDELYRMFQGGNAWSLAQLKRRFETGPVDWKAQLAPKLDPSPK